ncbi:hypothetical protein CWO92_18755 [Heyndrickxia camelliae]|uniref:Uncharacterized protein n=1 Tax=Heyndrickxia camelliae TaxID=1707093 RepID=A0A2N3LGA9_9BACI|nr:hypothetical protein CWO92_18755 [Heyndrickxia camelliae]
MLQHFYKNSTQSTKGRQDHRIDLTEMKQFVVFRAFPRNNALHPFYSETLLNITSITNPYT